MKAKTFLLLILSCIVLESCNFQERRVSEKVNKVSASFSTIKEITQFESGTNCKIKSEAIGKLSGNPDSAYNLEYELHIFVNGLDKPLLDTIKTDLLRSVVPDSILYAVNGSDVQFNSPSFESFNVSPDKERITLMYTIKNDAYEYPFQYVMHIEPNGTRGEIQKIAIVKSVSSMKFDIKNVHVVKE